jgi:hypothetical protein
LVGQVRAISSRRHSSSGGATDAVASRGIAGGMAWL